MSCLFSEIKIHICTQIPPTHAFMNRYLSQHTGTHLRVQMDFIWRHIMDCHSRVRDCDKLHHVFNWFVLVWVIRLVNHRVVHVYFWTDPVWHPRPPPMTPTMTSTTAADLKQEVNRADIFSFAVKHTASKCRGTMVVWNSSRVFFFRPSNNTSWFRLNSEFDPDF